MAMHMFGNKKMTMCRKYPVSFKQYFDKHKDKYGTFNAEDRYLKAKFYYNALKRPWDFDSYIVDWIYERYGKDVKPEIAFDIWWDL